MSEIQPDADLAFAGRLADAAREVVRELFRAGLTADNKHAEGFDPVTEADRAIETRLREMIEAHAPEDGILGEEHGSKPSKNGRTWILDPVDGTRAFIAGIPTWTVLIGLDAGEGPALSVIDQPHIGERFYGLAHGETRRTELDHDGARRTIRASGTDRLGKAILTSTDSFLFQDLEADAFEAVRRRVRLTRFGLDAYGYAMLALGGIDLVIESGLQPWDIAALVPVVRGAGGVVTDWAGRERIETGQVVAAATPDLHAEALALLKSAAV